LKEDFFTLRTVLWEDAGVKMIDQTLLPQKLVYKRFDTWEGVADAIRRMVVRGAPAIGVAAAMGVAVAAQNSKASTRESLLKEIDRAAAGLRSTRPTAVNLFWGIDRVVKAAKGQAGGVDNVVRATVSTAVEMAEEDVEANRRLGKAGEVLLDDGDVVMTQCNAGALATVGYGTALGVIRAAREAGKCIKVIVNETRPALQGSRLTAFELVRDGFHCTLISDTAVGHMMSRGRVDKIGTYQVAVLASRHGIPFYPAAPHSTFDMQSTHEKVVIEERAADEVVRVRGRRIAPKGIAVANPAFDETPPELVSAIITDKGIIGRPISENIAAIMG